MKITDFYKSTFSQVHTSKPINLEDFEKMKINKNYENEPVSVLERVKSRKKTNMRRFGIFAMVTCLIAASIGIVYMLNGLGMINGPFSSNSPAAQIGEETDLTETAVFPVISETEITITSTILDEASSIQSDIETSIVQTEESDTVKGYGLKDLIFPFDSSIYFQPYTGDLTDSTAVIAELISFQGYADSAEYQATTEWFNFYKEYDIEAALATNFDSADYIANSAYSREMADKLDEIAAKYQLRLHTGFEGVSSYESLYSHIGKSNFFIAESVSGGGYAYDDGTFQMDSIIELLSGTTLSLQFRSTSKGSLDTVTLTIGNISEYTEWTYKTNSGISVLLATSPGKSLLFADLENTFIAVNIAMDYTSKSTLEEFADSINFDAIG